MNLALSDSWSHLMKAVLVPCGDPPFWGSSTSNSSGIPVNFGVQWPSGLEVHLGIIPLVVALPPPSVLVLHFSHLLRRHYPSLIRPFSLFPVGKELERLGSGLLTN